MSQQIESVKMALQELGINASGEFYYNPDYDLLIAHEKEHQHGIAGKLADTGADDLPFAQQLADQRICASIALVAKV